MVTHLNCIDKSIQFKWVPTTYLYKEIDKTYTDSNLKTMELLECALTGVCVIRYFACLVSSSCVLVDPVWHCDYLA